MPRCTARANGARSRGCFAALGGAHLTPQRRCGVSPSWMSGRSDVAAARYLADLHALAPDRDSAIVDKIRAITSFSAWWA